MGPGARPAATRAAGTVLALDRLQVVHGLDDRERQVLILCAAPCLDVRYHDLYAMMEARASASGWRVGTALDFLGLSLGGRIEALRMFSADAPLVRDELVRVEADERMAGALEMQRAGLRLSPRTLRTLTGQGDLDFEFRGFSTLETPRADFDQVVMRAEDRGRILTVIERHDEFLRCRSAWGFDRVIRYGRGMLLLFHGPPGTGKTMAAHAVAARMGRKVLRVDIPEFLGSGKDERRLSPLFREARFHDAVLFFEECDVLFYDRQHGNKLMSSFPTEVESFDGVAILAANTPRVLDRALERRLMLKLHFPRPDRGAREEIWRRHLPPEAPVAEDVDLGALASRYELSGGLIRNAVLLAAPEAFRPGGPSARITMAHLERAAEECLRAPGEHVARVSRPRVRLDDLVVPPALRFRLDETVTAARELGTVLERWGIAARLTRGRGIAALFHGPPGTGKTLAAEAVAGELGRPLLTVSLPAVVSMYVGETEKNLSTLFSRARAMRGVLFLDECDSLLAGREGRTVARHDILAVAVLLDEIERHQGVTILATNLPDILDRALLRRVGFHLRFDVPDAGQRALIWRRLLGTEAPLAPGRPSPRPCSCRRRGGGEGHGNRRASHRLLSLGWPRRGPVRAVNARSRRTRPASAAFQDTRSRTLTKDVWTSYPPDWTSPWETGMLARRRPGEVRDAIIRFLTTRPAGASVTEVIEAVHRQIGDAAPSSVRSYLRLNAPDVFIRRGRGHYSLRNVEGVREAAGAQGTAPASSGGWPEFSHGRAVMVLADCIEWLSTRAPCSIHAVVTDPPYGLVEYTKDQQEKLRKGCGGVWRIPPSFDGSTRSPLPRFTVLTPRDLEEIDRFFFKWARVLLPALVPGANVVVASNPLVSYVVSGALARAGLERRGEIVRLVMTMRGGDRPKAAHEEFAGVSVMPRSMWEPWLLFRRPIKGRVRDNLRRWGTGGFRRPSDRRPFGDVIQSSPTNRAERKIAPHPSLKPQAFLRELVRGVLPLGEGIVLDPFAGSGSTLAAAETVGYASIGVEKDPAYFELARTAIPRLAAYKNGLVQMLDL